MPVRPLEAAQVSCTEGWSQVSEGGTVGKVTDGWYALELSQRTQQPTACGCEPVKRDSENSSAVT